MAEKFSDSVEISDSSGRSTIRLQGEGGEEGGSAIRLLNGDGKETVLLGSDFCNLILGNSDEVTEPPGIYLNNPEVDEPAVRIEGRDDGGLIGIKNDTGTDTIHLKGNTGDVWLGGHGENAQVFLQDAGTNRTIHLDGKAGDIKLLGGDCAEYFDIAGTAESVEPGMVMVTDEDGQLRPSQDTYDRRVVGVLSGAGDLQPGILLGNHKASGQRPPLAMTGKVYCKADARETPIAAGDLLTSAVTPGHAMKAADPKQAFGAVIGKALRPLEAGTDLVPIIVALQ